MTVTRQQALCCLIAAAEATAAGNSLDPFDHAYPSTSLTWPYCTHSAVVARAIAPTNIPPAHLQLPQAADPNTTGVIWFDRFEIDVVRCGPPAPDDGSCLADLYGSCASPVDHSTLAGHHAAVEVELDALRSELLGRWCDCLVALDAGYGRHAPRWFESISVVTGGRFTAVRLIVGTRLG